MFKLIFLTAIFLLPSFMSVKAMNFYYITEIQRGDEMLKGISDGNCCRPVAGVTLLLFINVS